MQKSIDLKAALLDSFIKQKHCDVIFTCKESKSNKWIKIGAHKTVLAAVSDVFETMFFGEIVLNDGVCKDAEIKIEDIHMEAFHSFLGFIYGEKITFDCADIALNFLYAADKYNSDEAKNFIEEYILKDVDAQNAITYYETAEMMSLNLLKNNCLKTFEGKTLDVLFCPNFVNAKPDTLHKIFSLECCTINSEINFVWALERYINFNQLSEPKIFEKVRPALKCIRFLTLEGKDVARTTLLSEEEKKRVIDKSLKEKQGLSTSCTERGISGTMKILKAVQSLYSDHYCRKCQIFQYNSNHPFWLCTHIYNQGYKNAVTIVKEVYDKYHHIILPAYKKSDLKKVYGAYKLAGLITD